MNRAPNLLCGSIKCICVENISPRKQSKRSFTSMLHGNTPLSVHHSNSYQPPVGSPPTQEDLWHLPGRLRINPSLWDKEDVALWLHWAQKEYSLRRPERGHFEMNGRALCLLTKEDFRRRCPSSGDVLYEILQCVKMQRRSNPPKRPSSVLTADGEMSHRTPPPGSQESATGGDSQACSGTSGFQGEASESVRNYPVIVSMRPTPVTHTNASAALPTSLPNQDGCPLQSEAVTQEPLNLSNPNKETKRSPLHIVSGQIPECRLLWDYVYQLLCDDRYQEYIRWEDQDSLVFRVVDPNGLARLWGNHKKRQNMTYEKLSRALRHYYKLNIIKKERGQKLLFRFLKLPTNTNVLTDHCKKAEDTQAEDLQDSSSPQDLSEDHFEVSPDRSSPQPPT